MMTIKELLTIKEYHLHRYLINKLESNGYEVKATTKYIYATNKESKYPVCLIAHLDTVWELPPREEDLIYDAEKDIMMGIDGGIGADDRAGVYVILSLLSKGIYPQSIIFTHDEEIGGIGAYHLIADFPTPECDYRYLIQIDRQGFTDCVFYNCDNKEFVAYVESFGWIEEYGTFTDISIIAPVWDIAAVNLSAAYVNEHCDNEYLKPKYLEEEITARVAHMVEKSEHALAYSYIPREIKQYRTWNFTENEPTFVGKVDECYYCGIKLNHQERYMYGFYDKYYICRDCKDKHHPDKNANLKI